MGLVGSDMGYGCLDSKLPQSERHSSIIAAVREEGFSDTGRERNPACVRLFNFGEIVLVAGDEIGADLAGAMMPEPKVLVDQPRIARKGSPDQDYLTHWGAANSPKYLPISKMTDFVDGKGMLIFYRKLVFGTPAPGRQNYGHGGKKGLRGTGDAASSLIECDANRM